MIKFKDPVYHTIQIQEPVLEELIKSAPVKRLKKINQYGLNFIYPALKTTRFEHSLGVCFLLQKLGASLEEQIAGLLHDIGHTVFSHVADFIYPSRNYDYHHSFFKNQFFNSEIPQILKKYNFPVNYFLHYDHFPFLEQKIPALCADRLDYFFRDALIYKIITAKEIDKYLVSLKIEKQKIICPNKRTARWLANKYLETNLKAWGHPKPHAFYEILAQIMRVALKEKIIKEDNLFTVDKKVLKKLKRSKNQEILNKFKLLSPQAKVIEDKKNYDFFSQGKVRYLDPKVKLKDGCIKKLSVIDQDFKKKIAEHNQKMSKGYYLRIEL